MRSSRTGYDRHVEWAFIWLMVVLKIPVVALLWLVWYAVRAEPVPGEEEPVREDGGGGPPHPHHPRPRLPRRGPHRGPVPAPPARIRARARSTRPSRS